MYGKILEFIKNNLAWIALVLGVLVMSLVGLRACQRHLDIDITASRNRVVVDFGNDSHSSTPNRVKPSKKK